MIIRYIKILIPMMITFILIKTEVYYHVEDETFNKIIKFVAAIFIYGGFWFTGYFIHEHKINSK
jgi:hypothetical protein